METGLGNEPEIGADVQRQLDGNGIEVVLKTNLANEGEGNLGITVTIAIFPAPHSDAGTETGIPAEVAAKVAGPLVNTSEAEVGVVVIAAPTEVGLKAIAAQAPHGGEFGTITLATADADTVARAI